MSKIISLFNHKGGVSKTTTTFHLAWKLARLGKRVLMVDADSQCNLTGLALGIDDYDSLFRFYDSKRNNDIYSVLAPAFGLEGNQGTAYLSTGVETTKTICPNLSILAGHINFAKFELQLATALTSSQSIPILRPLIGAMHTLLRKTADRNNFDYIIVDMSPSIAATNMCLLMSSDFFIIPTSPDFFCYQAIDSLSSVLPEWASKVETFKDGITLPRENPKLLGIISQNYRIYTTEKEKEQKTMTKAFSEWANKIKEITNNQLVKKLSTVGMVVSEDIFRSNVTHDVPYNLANIQDFNSLVAVSQKKSKPMFELTQEDGGWSGAVWEKEVRGEKAGVHQNIIEADNVYTKLSNSVIGMTK